MDAQEWKQLWPAGAQADIFKAIGIFLICLFVTVLALIPRNSSAETVTPILSSATTQGVGAWNFTTVSCNVNNTPICVYGPLQISDYFPWMTTDEVCNHLYSGSTFDGSFFCESGGLRRIYLAGVAGLKNIYTCPTGITLNSANQCASCPAVVAGETAFTLDPGGTTCSRQDCPANSSRSGLYPNQCTCNTGYKFDAVGGICVPLRECTIPDLPPITDPEVQLFEDNPNLADTTRLTPRMQTALSCLRSAAAAGSPSVGSAYRPPAYNQHLIDVWKKWREFETDENYDQQDCAARKEKIRLHFKTHGLKEKQPPVPNSLHTKGEAVDVTINLPAANIDALAATCHLYRPPTLRITDPVHFIYR